MPRWLACLVTPVRKTSTPRELKKKKNPRNVFCAFTTLQNNLDQSLCAHEVCVWTSAHLCLQDSLVLQLWFLSTAPPFCESYVPTPIKSPKTFAKSRTSHWWRNIHIKGFTCGSRINTIHSITFVNGNQTPVICFQGLLTPWVSKRMVNTLLSYLAVSGILVCLVGFYFYDDWFHSSMGFPNFWLGHWFPSLV